MYHTTRLSLHHLEPRLLTMSHHTPVHDDDAIEMAEEGNSNLQGALDSSKNIPLHPIPGISTRLPNYNSHSVSHEGTRPRNLSTSINDPVSKADSNFMSHVQNVEFVYKGL